MVRLRRLVVAFALASTASIVPPSLCAGLRPPVDGMIVARFAPTGAYSGHWGTDFAAAPGTPVAAAAAGIVTFAGTVAGTRTVTVSHGGGVRTSYSYLGSIGVDRGVAVAVGSILGLSGIHGGIGAVHLSLRVGSVYVDPERLLGCDRAPGPALRLEPATSRYPAYPAPDATWHPRRDLRSASSGTSGRR